MTGIHPGEPDPLTPRQMEVLGLVARGLSNGAIAELLGVSANTVKVHVAAILGALDVANRTEAVLWYRKLLEAGTGVGRAEAQTAARIGRPAIAVLPFSDPRADRDPDHLADGLAEDLIARLSGWRWFPVIAHTSSRGYRAGTVDVTVTGAALGASYLITGRLRRGSSQIRVNVHVVEARRGEVLWSQAFDSHTQTRTEDLLQTQNEIARRVIAAIAPELINVEGRREHTEPCSFDAWRTTVRAMWHLNRQTLGDVRRALELFDDATAIDAEHALAWYGRCLAHQYLIWEQLSEDPPGELAALQHAAAECFRLEPDSCQAQTVAGLAAMLGGDRDGAIAHLEAAVRINPSASQALSLLGQCYGVAGRTDDCIVALEETLRLNPFSASRWMYLASIGMAHFVAERYDEAVRWSERALGEGGDVPASLVVLAAAHVERGDLETAREVVARLASAHPRFDLARHLRTVGASSRRAYVERFRVALARVGLTV